ncbi:uncharacterized protein LOC123523037 [Mercenaria mercenaria]|uniref:uncharacterized protein LOC123523037 n=1 Tax=Mercenaria mercenaria TaxID=6596 RepID=UPI00234E674D|nr:uncharacterized protein LOC123523037 [Mercenaria mercenaria]
MSLEANLPGRNWVRGALGLKLLQQGLKDPVDRLVERFHQKLLESYVQKTGSPANACSECTLENLLPEHSRSGCIHKFKSKCFCSNPAGRRTCPNNFCSRLYDLIILAHEERNPSWCNTDPNRWYSDHWSLAQCFVASTGYADKNSAAKTDVGGLLSVVINNIDIRSNRHNTDHFVKARECRNNIMHSTNFEVQDAQLITYIDSMITVLKDPALFLYEPEAVVAVDMLEKLKESQVTITTEDIASVIEDAIVHNTRRAEEQLDENKQQMIDRLENLRTQLIQDIKDTAVREQQRMAELVTEHKDDITELAKNKMAELAKKHVDHMNHQEEELERKSKQHEKEMSEKAMKLKLEITATAKNSTADTVTPDPFIKRTSGLSTRMYKQMKKDLKTDLIVFYRRQHSTLPLSPLQEENDAPLIDFYVTPTLTVVKPGKAKGKDKKKYVETYSDIFSNDRGSCLNIYVSSSAGNGKSAFSKRMAVTWCQAQQPIDSNKKYFSEFTKDLGAMKMFPYLFLISLRDIVKGQCNVDSMIISEILEQLAGVYPHTFLIQLLREERSLIILDGLDEWSHPSYCRTASEIPHRKIRRNCTVLTTTRPWKLDVVRLSSCEIDQQIEMLSLKHEQSVALTNKVIKYLNTKNELSKPYADFEEIVKKKTLNKLYHIPLILMQLLCLWYDGEPIGKSLCQIYTNVLEFIFKRAFRKSKELAEITFQNLQSSVTTDIQLPRCFEAASNCRKCKSFLISLGKLAFEQIFSKDRGSSIVFDISIAERRLSDLELKFAFETGILTRSKTQDQKLTSKCSSVSFIHKSYQEFLAALYICEGDLPPSTIFTAVNSVAKLLDICKILVFVSGLNGSKMDEMFFAMQGVISRDGSLQQYRRTCDIYSENRWMAEKIQNMMIDCLEENINCGGIGVRLPLTDAVISDYKVGDGGYVSLLKRLLPNTLSNIQSVNLCYPDTVITELQEMLKSICTLQKLSVDTITGVLPDVVVNMLTQSSQTLKVLHIFGDINDKTFQAAIHLDHVEALSLRCTSLNSHQLETLYEYISRRTGMRELCLEKLEHSQRVQEHSLDLTLHNRLEKLQLMRICTRNIRLPESVTCLEVLICDVEMIERNIKMLSDADHLEEVVLWSDQSKPISLDDLFTQLVYLQKLELQHFTLSDLNVSHYSKHLEKITLRWVTMSSASFQRFVDSLTDLEQTVAIKLRDCEIKPVIPYAMIVDKICKSHKFVIGENKKAKDPYTRISKLELCFKKVSDVAK